MKNPLLLSVFIVIFAIPAFTQVAVNYNNPPYPMTALAGWSGNPVGSTRQLSVTETVGGALCNTAGGEACTFNWSCTATSGITCSFSDLTHSAVSALTAALPTVTLNVGGVAAGSCSISPSNTHTGPWVTSAVSSINVTAQSTDDTTQSVTIPILVCANQGPVLADGESSVRVLPAYDQAFANRFKHLQSFVKGCVDESVVWSITGQPAGGDGSLWTNPQRDVLFSATVTGRYTITATAACNGGTNSSLIYVVPGPAPAYATTPNGTEPVPCVVDPENTGPDYEIGAGFAYSTISSTPPFNTIPAGTTIRIHNTDTTGLNPSVYPEYYQISNSGAPTNPLNVCGVPDALGNLPIISGTNATGQSGINTGNDTVGYGLFTLWVEPGHSAYWQSGPFGPSYARIAGLSFQNANPSNTYTQPGGVIGPCTAGSPTGSQKTCNWGEAAALQVRSGGNVTISGIESNNNPVGIFTDDNVAGAGFGILSHDVMIEGSNLHNCGWPQSGTHCLYLQTMDATVQGNRIGPGADSYYTSAGQDGPSDLKFRGSELVARDNVFGGSVDRVIDAVQAQGGSPAYSITDYIALLWSGVTLSGYDTAGADVIAAYYEGLQKDFVYSNIIPTAFGGAIHYGDDTGQQTLAIRDGILYFYNNTVYQSSNVFDTGNCSLGFKPCSLDLRNNIFYPAAGTHISVFADYADVIMNSTATNLFLTTPTLGIEANSVSAAVPLLPGYYADGSTSTGWSPNSRCSDTGFNLAVCLAPKYPVPVCSNGATCLWALTVPMNTHVGLGGFLFTPTQPFTSGTFIPPSGSAAIGAGTPLTGYPAQLPLRFNPPLSSMTLLPRLHPLTIGAVDDGGTGPVVSTPVISPSGGTYSSTQSVTITDSTPGATIYYTIDGTTPTTSSSVYSSAITVPSTETVQAIAGAIGYTQSATASAIYTITVSGASQTITFANPGTQIVGTPLTLSATASSGLAVSFTSTTTGICTVSGTSVTFIASGTCIIDANQTGNSTYAAAPQVQQSFTVNGEGQTITFGSPVTQTVDVPLILSATATSALAVTFNSTTTGVCTVSGTTATFIAPGTCTIDANQSGNSTYAAAPQVQQSFAVVVQQPLTLAAGTCTGAFLVGGQLVPTGCQLLTVGGTPPYTFSVSTAFDPLPNGLTLNTSTGAITGAVSSQGTYTTDIIVTDSSSPAATANVPLTFPLTMSSFVQSLITFLTTNPTSAQQLETVLLPPVPPPSSEKVQYIPYSYVEVATGATNSPWTLPINCSGGEFVAVVLDNEAAGYSGLTITATNGNTVSTDYVGYAPLVSLAHISSCAPGTTTITATATGTGGTGRLQAARYTGLLYGTLDSLGLLNAGSGVSPSCSVSASNPNELVVVDGYGSNNGTGFIGTGASAYVLLHQLNNGYWATGYGLSAAGVNTFSETIGPSAWHCIMAVYK